MYFDVDAFLELRTRILDVLAAEARFGALKVAFVVVDDSAGRDADTVRLADVDDVSIIVPPFNLGHQRAIVYGARMALRQLDDRAVVVTLDSDGEDRPEDLPRLLAALMDTDREAIVLAQRTSRREAASFKVMYAVYRALFRVLTGIVIRTGNYAAYHASTGRRILRHPFFDLCYSSSFISLDTPKVFVPCARGVRYAGRSQMSYAKLVMHGLSMLMPFLDRIALRALITFVATLVASAVASTAVIATRLFTDAAVPGWATYSLLLLLILSFLSLGNFVVLFAIFAQSRGTSLGNLEDRNGSA